MAWTDTARRQHMRNGPGYPSDLRDGEWALIEPIFPSARRGGRPRTTCQRAVMDAILYIASSGYAWRMLPKCFPPVSTVRGYFYAWRDSSLLATINQLLVMTAREQAGRSNVQVFLDKDLPDTRAFITMLGKVMNRLSQDQISSAILLLRV